MSRLPRVLTAAIAGVVTLTVLGGVAGAAPARPSDGVAPEDYAAEVCPPILEFYEAFLVTDDVVEAAEYPEDAQIDLVDALDDTLYALEDLLEVLDTAGIPKVKQGRRAVALYEREFGNVYELFLDAQVEVSFLEPADIDFWHALSELRADVGAELNAAMDELDVPAVEALNTALDEDPVCQEVG
jgi:hypothetical protein